jgi:hypothetical protein
MESITGGYFSLSHPDHVVAAFPGIGSRPEKSESNRGLLGCGDGNIDELNAESSGP